MTESQTYKLEDVYGISRQGVPQTYVPRADVDDRFVNEITREQHIVIYGSSKQGKSSLLRTVLKDDDYVAIQCAMDWDKGAVYRALLKEIGIAVAETETNGVSGARELTAEIKGEGGVPLIAKASGRTMGAKTKGTSQSIFSRSIEFDPSSATDVIRVLQEAEFDKWVVLEDFHYLAPDVQRIFASKPRKQSAVRQTGSTPF